MRVSKKGGLEKALHKMLDVPAVKIMNTSMGSWKRSRKKKHDGYRRAEASMP